MTERGDARLRRTAGELAIGPSAMRWDGAMLSVSIKERTAPFGYRIDGEVQVRPLAMTGQAFLLDAEGRHRWFPLAPRARVDVALRNPPLRWSGIGYLDANSGDVPLEDSFRSWTWSRAGIGDRTAILYEVSPHRGAGASLALLIDAAGDVSRFAPPPSVALPPTRWRIARQTRADNARAELRRTLEDTPFYARSLVNARLLGCDVVALHESLSLARFRAPWVQALLPFRMPRSAQ